jgi:exonuclease III
VLSWNVNGLRALLDKDPDVLDRVAREEDADVVVLNETKLQEKMVPEMDARVLPEFPHRRWNCATARLGYSGVAIFCRDRVVRATRTKRFPNATPRDSETDDSFITNPPPDDGSDETFRGSSPVRTPVFTSDPFEVPGFENEGRVVTAELDAFFVVGAYVPNSGSTLGRLAPRISAWDPAAAAYLRSLERRGKPVVFCGDLNVARGELDLWGRHAENAKCAGYTPEERESFEGLFVGGGGGGGGKDDGGEDVTRARATGGGSRTRSGRRGPGGGSTRGGATGAGRGRRTGGGGSITSWCRASSGGACTRGTFGGTWGGPITVPWGSSSGDRRRVRALCS